MEEFNLDVEETGQTLAAVLRGRLRLSWSAARALCQRGKVFVEDRAVLDPGTRLGAGTKVAVRRAARTPLTAAQQQALQSIVYEDSQVIVVDKPAGLQSVPYERGDTDTAMDLIRRAWRAQNRPATSVPLHVVHRIDKETSGLLLLAKTRHAERALQALWRKHDIERRYLCVVHGRITDRCIESYLVADRGDGLRGSLRPSLQGARAPVGKRAITQVQVLTYLGSRATLCAVQLLTGKTHQIRIHMAESGHPVVGERVYIRDYLRHGGVPIDAPRLLLHAETLGFCHPTTQQMVRLVREPPADFQNALAQLQEGRS